MADESLRDSIGRAAKAARLRVGLNQREVADTIDINSEVYGYLERGVLAQSIGTMRRLRVALGISADEAFGLEPSGASVAALEPV